MLSFRANQSASHPTAGKASPVSPFHAAPGAEEETSDRGPVSAHSGLQGFGGLLGPQTFSSLPVVRRAVGRGEEGRDLPARAWIRARNACGGLQQGRDQPKGTPPRIKDAGRNSFLPALIPSSGWRSLTSALRLPGPAPPGRSRNADRRDGGGSGSCSGGMAPDSGVEAHHAPGASPVASGSPGASAMHPSEITSSLLDDRIARLQSRELESSGGR